jgi:hypothetical protein
MLSKLTINGHVWCFVTAVHADRTVDVNPDVRHLPQFVRIPYQGPDAAVGDRVSLRFTDGDPGKPVVYTDAVDLCDLCNARMLAAAQTQRMEPVPICNACQRATDEIRARAERSVRRFPFKIQFPS